MSKTLALFTALLLIAAAAAAQTGSVEVRDAWARATPGKADIGAAYLTLESPTDDRLTGLSTPVASTAQVHTMTMEGGVMKMRPVEGGLEIKPGESVMLKPGGYHVMFRELKHPLEQGATVKATLKFEHAGTVEVNYPVLALGAAAPGASAGGTMMQGSGGGMNMQGSGGGMMHMDKR